MTKNEKKSRQIFIIIGSLIVFFIFLLILIFLFSLFFNKTQFIEKLEKFSLSLGPFLPLGFILSQALQTFIAPIPAQPFGIFASLTFGPLLGTIYTLLGVLLGSLIAYYLAYIFGKKILDRFVKGDVISRFEGLREEKGGYLLFLLYILPGIPDDILAFLAGFFRMNIFIFISAVVLGRLPAILTLILLGGTIADFNYLSIVIILSLVFFFLILFFKYRKILNYLRKNNPKIIQ